MGVRPTIKTVFGVDTFDQYDKVDFEATLDLDDVSGKFAYVADYAYDRQRKRWRQVYEFMHFGNEDCGNEGVAGLIIPHGRVFDSDVFRVLAMLYPEFMESGYRDVPLLADEFEIRWCKNSSHFELMESRFGIAFRDSWMYQQAYCNRVQIWAWVTKWLFDWLGVETNVDDYKWMLVWEWC